MYLSIGSLLIIASLTVTKASDGHNVHTSYEEKLKEIEVPIYKKYELPVYDIQLVKDQKNIHIPIPQPYQVPVKIPVPHPIHVEKELQIFVDKYEPQIIEKKIPFLVKSVYPEYQEKKIPIPIPKPVAVYVPYYKHVYHHSSKH